jgi:Heterokaryon incompatibility protein (HET)
LYKFILAAMDSLFKEVAGELGIPVITIPMRTHRQRSPICASELFGRLEPHTLDHEVLKYTYNALSTTSSFRLLELLSNEEDDMIKCNMFEADLENEETPSYIALSYTWDDENSPSTVCQILVNGNSLGISLNLWNFLQNYRCTTGRRIIWIDQICIDQKNISERTQQVRQMWRIYARANMDLFWIGEPDETTEDVMGILKALSRACTSILENRSGSTDFPTVAMFSNSTYLAELGLPEFDSPIWAALMHFISRPVFQRIWITQEIAVSCDVKIFCGFLMIPFSVFGTAATFLVESSWIKILHDKYIVQGRAGFLTGMWNCRIRHQSGQPQSMDMLLASTRRFKSSQAVDKIFALANLSYSKTQDDMPPAFVPDYSKSVLEVYRAATLHLIEAGSLDIMSGIEDRHLRQEDHGLPSWVPDFSVHQESSILCMPPRKGIRTTYAAATALPVRYRHSLSDPNLLWLSSHRIDRIIELSSPETATQPYPQRLEAWAQMVNFSSTYPPVSGRSEPIIQAFWRTLVGNMGLGFVDYPVPQDWIHLFVASVERGKRKLSHSLIWQFGLNKDKVMKFPLTKFTPGIDSILEALNGVVSLDERTNVDDSLFESTVHHISFFRRFFITESGYFGFALSSVAVGDEVFLFSGGRAPFIVRKVDSTEEYQVLGDCYLHGIMDGELLENGDIEWLDLCLR